MQEQHIILRFLVAQLKKTNVTGPGNSFNIDHSLQNERKRKLFELLLECKDVFYSKYWTHIINQTQEIDYN